MSREKKPIVPRKGPPVNLRPAGSHVNSRDKRKADKLRKEIDDEQRDRTTEDSDE